jgi:large subunit ribosomal protein L10
MNRQEKKQAVTELKGSFERSQAAFLVNYQGLSVSQMQTLRRSLREKDASLVVSKARLMKIAAEGIEGIEEFRSALKQQVGLVFANGEVPPIAKQLVEFSKKNKALGVISGFFESKALDSAEVVFLATIPPREVLLSQLVGTLQAPISGFARVLQAPLASLLYALKRVSEKTEQEVL